MIEPVARLRVELRDIEPAIWRRADIPLSTTLLTLHDVIQSLFGWEDRHLFEFQVAGKAYGVPLGDDAIFGHKIYQAKALRLRTLLDRGVDRFLYVYDLGDDWQHDVIVEAIFDGSAETDYPIFVDGARRAPPEDIGGAAGYAHFQEAIDHSTNEQDTDLRDWYECRFDPEQIDEQQIRTFLAPIAERRRGASVRSRTRSIGQDA